MIGYCLQRFTHSCLRGSVIARNNEGVKTRKRALFFIRYKFKN